MDIRRGDTFKHTRKLGWPILFISLAFSASLEASPLLEAIKTDDKLEVKIESISQYDEIEIRIHSSRNTVISKNSDRSPHHPEGPLTPATSEIWYPLACSYTSAFFGLAVLEELKLQKNE